MKLVPRKLTSLALATVLALSSSIPALAASNVNPVVNVNANNEVNQIDVEGFKTAVGRAVFTIVIRSLSLYSKGKKISERVEESEIEDAIKEYFDITFYSSGRDLATWNVGRGKDVVLEAGDDSSYGFEHILAKHVPKYFNQYDEAEEAMNNGDVITFFDKNDDIKDVYENLDYVIKKYKSKISQDGFKNREERFKVKGKDGENYILIIKGGEVITFYPDRWNKADIFETYQGPGIPV
ncbi:hypothetical protein [Brevibacillus formosus]|uniref:hypothetical protein n=1 Tax=Brevibacillus formosus TaxID=54913 RepID=UPI003F1CE8A5